MSIGMKKKMVNIRLSEEILGKAKKIAEKNKKNYEHPNSISGVILAATIEYLTKKGEMGKRNT